MVKEFSTHQDEWAVILGGSSGFGLASARKLAAHGMNICIVHRNARSEMDGIKASFSTIAAFDVKVLSFNVDILNPEKRAEILNELKIAMGANGMVKCLLHSIAKGNLKPMVDQNQKTLTESDFLLTLQNMALSLNSWVDELFKAQLFADDARVIAFTSEGSKRAWKSYAAVSAAKATLEALTRNIALEYAPYGIRANCIQPGITDTRSLRMIPGSEELISQTKIRNPFKRLTLPEDVANVVYLLCKPEAAWINGTVIPVDGGEQIN
ncbi:MAG: SDR family oxidoreductase [Pedobacter sp.]|nr:MAG: SDR family oxidoreductase [Pedobacter sp.]